MSKMLLLGLLAILPGCNVTLERSPTVTIVPPEFYTRAEVDAINAESACRSLARNQLQMDRCTVRR
jgi:hypothetical protein